MSIVAEILSLRRSQTSSVEILLGALDWQKSAQDKQHILARGYAVIEAADTRGVGALPRLRKSNAGF